jgi:flagellar hook-associated protein 3
MQYQIQQSEQGLQTALQQVSTNKRVNQLSDDPAASANMVFSLTTSANVDQYTKNVSSISAQLQTAGSSLSSVVTSLSQAITLGTSGTNDTLTAANRQAIAVQVQGVLSDVIAQANMSYGGSYLFGGSSNQTPPFAATSTAFTSAQGSLTAGTSLTPGSVTSISDAATGSTFTFKATSSSTIASLTAAVAAAVTAGTLSAGTTATISGGKLVVGPNTGTSGLSVSSNDTVLGSIVANPNTAVANGYVYVGNSSINSVQIGDSTSVATNLPGNQLFSGSGTNSVIGTLASLITALQSGTQSQISTATAAISTASGYVGQQRGSLDSTVNQLNSQESYLSQEKLTLTTQQTSLVGIDLATAITNLSQAQLNNSAVLAATGKILPQTLLDYLK